MQSIPAHRTISARVKRKSGCRRDQKTKIAHGAAGNAANGFLKQQFRVICDEAAFAVLDTAQMEDEFYRSLRHLSRLYKFNPYVNTGFPFPHNIHTSYIHAKTDLQKKDKDLCLSIANDTDLPVSFVAEKAINPGWTLYYLPLATITRLHYKKDRQTMLLLLSVFAYLNQVVRMPVLDENDYLFNTYETIQDWLLESREEYDVDDFESNILEVCEFRRKRTIVENAVRNPDNLQCFMERLQTYSPADQTQEKFKKVAAKLYRLFQKFPDHNFYRNIPYDLDRDEDEYMIEPDMYFSFFWSSSGWLHDELMHYIQTDLQERSDHDAPKKMQWFDKPQSKRTVNLDFETRLINLICELANVIDKL